ncbi:hypothetical protein Pelo_10231 [Pelomyxa schiedti]|nr:hypothetical protein Pelo_10231 [Pelomyxa schiedti]
MYRPPEDRVWELICPVTLNDTEYPRIEGTTPHSCHVYYTETFLNTLYTSAYAAVTPATPPLLPLSIPPSLPNSNSSTPSCTSSSSSSLPSSSSSSSLSSSGCSPAGGCDLTQPQGTPSQPQPPALPAMSKFWNDMEMILIDPAITPTDHERLSKLDICSQGTSLVLMTSKGMDEFCRSLLHSDFTSPTIIRTTIENVLNTVQNLIKFDYSDETSPTEQKRSPSKELSEQIPTQDSLQDCAHTETNTLMQLDSIPDMTLEEFSIPSVKDTSSKSPLLLESDLSGHAFQASTDPFTMARDEDLCNSLGTAVGALPPNAHNTSVETTSAQQSKPDSPQTQEVEATSNLLPAEDQMEACPKPTTFEQLQQVQPPLKSDPLLQHLQLHQQQLLQQYNDTSKLQNAPRSSPEPQSLSRQTQFPFQQPMHTVQTAPHNASNPPDSSPAPFVSVEQKSNMNMPHLSQIKQFVDTASPNLMQKVLQNVSNKSFPRADTPSPPKQTSSVQQMAPVRTQQGPQLPPYLQTLLQLAVAKPIQNSNALCDPQLGQLLPQYLRDSQNSTLDETACAPDQVVAALLAMKSEVEQMRTILNLIAKDINSYKILLLKQQQTTFQNPQQGFNFASPAVPQPPTHRHIATSQNTHGTTQLTNFTIQQAPSSSLWGLPPPGGTVPRPSQPPRLPFISDNTPTTTTPSVMHAPPNTTTGSSIMGNNSLPSILTQLLIQSSSSASFTHPPPNRH